MRRFTTLAEVDSTSKWLTERLAVAKPWQSVRARVQTAGRGRLARSWFSGGADANLAFSMVVPVTRIEPGAISARVGLALHGVLSAYADVRLRWPNDIVAGGKKLAGVLITHETGGQHQDVAPGLYQVVVGIGVNVMSEDFPPELAGTATSLTLAARRDQAQATPSAEKTHGSRPLRGVRRLWLEIYKAVRDEFSDAGRAIDADFIKRYNSVVWPYVKRSEIADELLQFQTLLPDGRALCLSAAGPVMLDMAP